jgi:hypothetical protein
MSLTMPVARTLNVEELIEFYDNIIDAVDEDLVEKSVSAVLPKPETPEGLEGHVAWAPNGDPIAPVDVTELAGPDLGRLYSFINSWTNYVSSELGRAKTTLLVQERIIKVITAALRTYYREEHSVPESRVGDSILTDSRFAREDSDLLKIKVFASSLESRHDQLKRTCNYISREQTRRKDEWERQLHEEHGGKATSGKMKKRDPGKAFKRRR